MATNKLDYEFILDIYNLPYKMTNKRLEQLLFDADVQYETYLINYNDPRKLTAVARLYMNTREAFEHALRTIVKHKVDGNLISAKGNESRAHFLDEHELLLSPSKVEAEQDKTPSDEKDESEAMCEDYSDKKPDEEPDLDAAISKKPDSTEGSESDAAMSKQAVKKRRKAKKREKAQLKVESSGINPRLGNDSTDTFSSDSERERLWKKQFSESE